MFLLLAILIYLGMFSIKMNDRKSLCIISLLGHHNKISHLVAYTTEIFSQSHDARGWKFKIEVSVGWFLLKSFSLATP